MWAAKWSSTVRCGTWVEVEAAVGYVEQGSDEASGVGLEGL